MDEKFNKETLNLLETRVQNLEEKVVGVNYDYHSKITDDIVTVLALLGSKLGNALSTRDRMMMVMKRSDELKRYLDPDYADGIEDIDDDIKVDLILAQEDKLISQHENLSKLTSMKKCLDSQNLADTLNSLNSDLIKLWKKHEETSQEVENQSQVVMSKIENYNSIVSFFKLWFY
ncbi:Dynactin subunit 3 [Armadillidium vulgare]|nr:Dynactin subunit 3 [Armadillidium vulgare]